MTKKPINQNDIDNLEFVSLISNKYLFNNEPVNHIKKEINPQKKNKLLGIISCFNFLNKTVSYGEKNRSKN